LTSRFEVGSYRDQEEARVFGERSRDTDFILGLGLSESQLRSWLWLRAAEWANWPSFVSQPIVPILFIFFPWPLVLASVFILDILWALVRYGYINVRAASYAVNFVFFTKWPVAFVSAILLFAHHRIFAGILTIAWPLGLAGVIAVPGQIGRLQGLFAKKIGPIAELLINDPSSSLT